MSTSRYALAGALVCLAVGSGGFLLRLPQRYPSAAQALATTLLVLLALGCLLAVVCAGRRRPIALGGWGAIVLGLAALWSTQRLTEHTVGSTAWIVALAGVLLILLGVGLNAAAALLGLRDG